MPTVLPLARKALDACRRIFSCVSAFSATDRFAISIPRPFTKRRKPLHLLDYDYHNLTTRTTYLNPHRVRLVIRKRART